MKPHLRRFAQTLSPELFHWCRSLHLRKRFSRQFKYDQWLFKEAFYPRNQSPEVLTGPFRGMFYLDETVWGPITPKWAGAYEMELEDIILDIARRGYEQILNIGCAEGYYSVGLALLDRKPQVFAFDLDPIARRQARRLARLNGVSARVRVFGKCTHFKLNKVITGKTLVVCDIEGHELFLLDPAKVPGLKDADLLIEVHEESASAGVQSVEERIAGRFVHSHDRTPSFV
jgi:Ribosomal protein L11 methyltransferase (PrmA)